MQKSDSVPSDSAPSDSAPSDCLTILARASYEAPAGIIPSLDRRVGIQLRATETGRFRWFHDDGSPTIAEGESPEAAHRAAWFAWNRRGLEVMQGESP